MGLILLYTGESFKEQSVEKPRPADRRDSSRLSQEPLLTYRM